MELQNGVPNPRTHTVGGKSANGEDPRKKPHRESPLHFPWSETQSARNQSNGVHDKVIVNDKSSDIVRRCSLRKVTNVRTKGIRDCVPTPKLAFSVAASVVFMLSVLCFCVSYDGDFLFDDVRAVTENKDVLPETPLSEVFRNDYWGQRMTSSTSHKSYRPITVLTFRLSYYLGDGLSPPWFHIPNILLHGVISILLLRVFSDIFGGYRVNQETRRAEFLAPKSALLCATLFAVHPIHTEAVASIVSRADLLCSLTWVMSFLLYTRSLAKELHKVDRATLLYRPTSFSVRHMLTSMILCFISIFCKEQGITVLGVCSIYDVFIVCRIHPTDFLSRLKTFYRQPWFWSLMKRHLVLLSTGVLTLGLRLYLMGSTPPLFYAGDNPHAIQNTILQRTLNYNYLYSLNAWILVHPWWLCCDWSMGCIPVMRSIYDPRVLAAASFWIVFGALLFTSFKGRPGRDQRVLTVALALVVVPFLPASNLFFRVGFVIAERILYLPSIGFCIIVTLGIRHICVMCPKQVQTVKAGVVFLIVCFVVRSIQRSSHWRALGELFYDGERVCPLNAKIHYNIAYHLADIGQKQASIERHRHAIKLNNRYHDAYNNLAILLRDAKNYEESVSMLKIAVDLKKNFVKGWVNLGLTYEEMGKYQEAEKCYLTSLHHNPNHFSTLTYLGRLYFTKLHLPDKAMEVWWNGTAVRPSEATNWYNIAAVLYDRGKYAETIDVIQQALLHVTGYPKLVSLLALIYKKQYKWEMSEKLYLDALRMETADKATANANLGLFYSDWGKYDLAEKHYRRSLEINPENKGVKGSLQLLLQKMGHI